MKAGTSATTPSAAFDCVVCGAQLDRLHTDTDREGLHCSFCGSLQGRTAGRADLKLVSPSGGTLDVGETLRDARKARGETLEQAANFTRIRLPYLRDLEAGDITSFDSYPGRVYARFFLREYADHLGLDAQPLVRRFDRDAEPPLQSAPPTKISRRMPHPGRWAAGALILLLAILTTGAINAHEGTRLPVARLTSTTGVVPTVPSRGDAHPTSAPAVAPVGLQAVVRTNLPCWIRAVVDGTTVMEKTVPAGRTVRLRASRTMDLRLGNAGGVTLTMNGRPVPTGDAGNVMDLSFTRRGGHVVVG